MNTFNENNSRTIESFTNRVQDNERPLLVEIKKALNFLSQNKALFNKCSFSLNEYKKRMIEISTGVQRPDDDSVGELAFYVYSIYIELELTLHSNMLVREQIQRFEELKKEAYFPNFLAIKQNLPYRLFSFYFSHPNSTEVQTLSQRIEEVREEKQRIDDMLKNKQAEALKIADTINEQQRLLEGLKTDYNFVGLSNGFSSLLKSKKRDKIKNTVLLTCLSILLFIPIATALFFCLDSAEGMSLEQHVFFILPLFSAEILLLYFYRISLLNNQSVKAQIAQLELRQTLCQFIQSYADYSKELKEKSQHTLERFENIIFSNVLLDSGSIPATLDGMEQISQLIRSIKK
ncbi:hypothetical protein [Vibrio algivorus]|uniref:Uncharacterized protein n=1 Tax=Vibrio algivorus TaxID=1667024 RepID=A0A557P5F6_9VIBR|nr:hypothetical protein [Vibrio algivorus]TVO35900.1 hypothetical protein FOF44_10940 [Vibrio algivorus]